MQSLRRRADPGNERREREMMGRIEQMTEDDRPIFWVECVPGGDDGPFFRVGDKHNAREITEIKPYTENGQMVGVPWLAVFSGSEIVARVNAANVTVISYK